MLCPAVRSEMTEHCTVSLKAKAGTAGIYLRATGEEDRSTNYANEGILMASAPRLVETVATPIEYQACSGGYTESTVSAARGRMLVETTSVVFEPGLGASWPAWVTEGHHAEGHQAEVRLQGPTRCDDSQRWPDAVPGWRDDVTAASPGTEAGLGMKPEGEDLLVERIQEGGLGWRL